MNRTARNAPCPCGSGRKYKRCCLILERELPTLEELEDLLELDDGPWPDDEALFEITLAAPELDGDGLGPTSDAAPRWFEVLEVSPGIGLRVRELAGQGASPAPFWIDDEPASYVLDVGSLFGSATDASEPVTVPNFWEGCPHCLARIEKGRSHRRTTH